MAQQAKTSAGTAAETGKDADDIEILKDQVSRLRTDIASIVELLGDIGERRGQSAVHSLHDVRDKAQQRGAEAAESARASVDAVQETFIDTVRKQPGTAVAMAVGLGFLVGYLNGRR